ncbi:MAG: LCP family protein [Eubacterium sp.]
MAIVNPKQHNLLLVSTLETIVPVQAKAVAKEKAGSYSSYDKLTHVGLYGNGTATNSSGQSVTASDWQWAQEVTWNPGYTALMDTLKHLYNFNVTNKDYHYVKINFTGFADLIDALGGIDVNVIFHFQPKLMQHIQK